MNELEKLLWALDPTGNAEGYTLTKKQLDELLDASIAVGQDVAEAQREEAYETGRNDGYQEGFDAAYDMYY